MLTSARSKAVVVALGSALLLGGVAASAPPARHIVHRATPVSGTPSDGSVTDTVPGTPVALPPPTQEQSRVVRDPVVRSPEVATLAANGIPLIALTAYRAAAAAVARTDPGCGLDWSLLAAIGRVESDHGRYGGATLHADGESTPHIIGIALDGTRSALIRDTDHGRLDGDPVYDHAVGPMQFIPGTWARWGADGNGDGVADPFNIFDAALAAARYLCAAGGDLRTVTGQTTAVLAYNHSDTYVAEVLALARTYATGVVALPTPLPVVTPPPVPPVNPAPPPALGPPAAPSGSPTTSSAAPTTSAPSSPTGCPSTSSAPNPSATPTDSVTPTPTETPSTETPSTETPSTEAPSTEAPSSDVPPSTSAAPSTSPTPTPSC